MNFKELQEDLFEAKKVTQDVPGRFAKVMLKDGNNVIAFYGKDDKIFVIDASIKNLNKFKKWNGRDAMIDIQKTGKKVRLATGRRVPTIRMRVEMKVDNDEDDGDKKELETSTEKEMVL
jgi:hypothetical protein